MYLRSNKRTMSLMEAWAAALNVTTSVDEAAALNKLLNGGAHKDLTIGIFPSAAFPTAEESTTKPPKQDLKVGTLGIPHC